MKRATGLALIALLAAAVAGFAIGFYSGRNAQPKGFEKVTLLGVSRSLLLDSLNLNPQQRRVVDNALSDAEKRATVSIEAMMQDVRTTTRAARERVRNTLDSNQRTKLDSILSRVPEMKPRTPLPQKEMTR